MKSSTTLSRFVVSLAAFALLLSFALPASADDNPAADGFNVAGSDAKAIELADRVMASMGGRSAWDNTRYISWRFFGARTHVWDKWTGVERFEQGDLVVIQNINSREGKAWKGGTELSGEELAAALKQGYEAWVNDSYWLVMPYKLKDSGVTLKYVGEGTTEEGTATEVVQMTFEGVGVTPQNKYHVHVGKDSGLVEQWEYFAEADQDEPQFKTPWANWQKVGNVMMSDSRGSGRFANAIADIRIHESVPEATWSGPGAVELP